MIPIEESPLRFPARVLVRGTKHFPTLQDRHEFSLEDKGYRRTGGHVGQSTTLCSSGPQVCARKHLTADQILWTLS